MASGRVIGVLSGCGGAGASVLAAVLAGCAAEPGGLGPGVTPGPVFLLDCDSMGGGIDVLLGCEQVPGPRWRQVHLRGGTLDPTVLLESLPRWNRVSFLAADSAADLLPDAVDRVIGAASQAGTVVVDLPRWPSPVRAIALERCHRVVLVVPAEVRAVTAGALIAGGLDASKSTVAVRGTCRNLPAQRIGHLLGLPVIGEIPYDPASLRPSGLNMSRLRRGSRRLARAVLATGPSGCEAAA
jgi:secretion/DNA translocation related CpaE-like protein